MEQYTESFNRIEIRLIKESLVCRIFDIKEIIKINREKLSDECVFTRIDDLKDDISFWTTENERLNDLYKKLCVDFPDL